MDFYKNLRYNKIIRKKRRHVIFIYNQIILSLSQQLFGHFQTEETGLHIQAVTEEIGRHMYQEI